MLFRSNPNLFFSEDLDDLKTYQDCMLKMIPELRFAEMLRYLQDFNVFNYDHKPWYKKFLARRELLYGEKLIQRVHGYN